MGQPLVGEPYVRANAYAQGAIVERRGALYKVRHCKLSKYQLTPLCFACASVGRVRGAERGEAYCACCGGTVRKPERRSDKHAKGYYAVRGGFQVQVRVKGVAKRRWLKSEDDARALAAQWLREKRGSGGDGDGADDGPEALA